MTALAAYFDAIVPLLRGELTPEAFECGVGAVCPRTESLAFYRTLMRRNARHILEQLFPATRRALDSLGTPAWEVLVERFDRDFPLRHWDPNQFGAAFPSFLGRLVTELPPFLEQVADFEWLCFVVTYAPSEPGEIGLEGRLQVRSYDYDIPAFVLDPAQSAPRAATVPVFVYRSFDDHRAHYHYATTAELTALALRSGAARAAELPDARILAAERRLVSAGVLPAAAEAPALRVRAGAAARADGGPGGGTRSGLT